MLDDIEQIEPPETPRVCRDPDDDKVVAVAIYGLADYLVTIDQDLLTADIVTQLLQLGIEVIDGSTLVRLLDEAHG